MPPPPSRLLLFNRLVHTSPLGDDGTANTMGPEELPCETKRASGFGEENHVANTIVQGLVLEARLVRAPDLSWLFLRGGHLYRPHLYTTVHTIDESLIVVSTAFDELDHRRVLLIYDAGDTSLLMIPSMHRSWHPLTLSTARALVVRRPDGGDKSYALVFPAQEFASLSAEGDAQYQDLLLLASSSSSTSPWKTAKKAEFPDQWRSGTSWFVAEEVFSSHGRAYWVDLLCGVIYCDCDDILSADMDCVHTRSLDLPAGCQYLGCRDEIAEAGAFRAMGPVGDSIKFVSIDGYLELVDLKDCKVRVWRLMKDMSWDVEYELSLVSLWEGVEFKGNFLPRGLVPMYPFLSTLEDHVVYFALGEFARAEKNNFPIPTDPCFLVRVDFHSKTFYCRAIFHRRHTSMASLLAVSRKPRGPSQVEDLKPCPSVS